MKNFKLLLATTAILSTGALAVMADTDSVSTTLKAEINLFSPFTINADGGLIRFPSITVRPQTNADSVKITIKPDGTIDNSKSNAQIINYWEVTETHNGIANYEEIRAITISGGFLSKLISAFSDTNNISPTDDNLNTSDGTFAEDFNVSLSANEISMKVDGTGAPCGTVKDLTRRWHYDTKNDAVELRFGGTFELYSYTENEVKKYFAPGADGFTSCSGEITVTFMTM